MTRVPLSVMHAAPRRRRRFDRRALAVLVFAFSVAGLIWVRALPREEADPAPVDALYQLEGW